MRLLIFLHIAVAHAAGTATLSLGDKAAFLLAPSNTATTQGANIEIVEIGGPAASGVPHGGWDVHISPDLKKSIDSTAAACKDPSQCYNAIRDALTNTNNNVEVRQIGTAIAVGVWGLGLLIAAVLTVFSGSDHRIPADIHVPPAQISAASSIHSASYSVVALVTGSNAPFATITPSPGNAPSPVVTSASVTTQSADSSDHKRGDIVFTITESQAHRWRDLIGMSNSSQCDLALERERNSGKRQAHDPLLSNVLCSSEIILMNMVGGATAGLTHALPQRFNWRDPDTNDAMHIFEEHARRYTADFNVDAAIADRYGIASFILAREVIIGHNDLIGDGTKPAPLFVAASDIDLDHPPKPACEDKELVVGAAGCRMVGAVEACTTDYITTTSCVDQASETFTTDKQLILTTIIIPWTVSNDNPYPKPTAATTTTAPGPHITCAAQNGAIGYAFVLNKYIDDFCARDLSIDQHWFGEDTQGWYGLHYKNAGHGWCNAANCASALKAGLKQCQLVNSVVTVDGSSGIDCGLFSWDISKVPSQACQSPDHASSRPFHRDMAMSFPQLLFKAAAPHTFTKDVLDTYTMHLNPCAYNDDLRAKSYDLVMTVTQITWTGTTATLSEQEIDDAVRWIVDGGCDTNTYPTKWGGWKVITTDTGSRKYTVLANFNPSGTYPAARPRESLGPPMVRAAASDCKDWGNVG